LPSRHAFAPAGDAESTRHDALDPADLRRLQFAAQGKEHLAAENLGLVLLAKVLADAMGDVSVLANGASHVIDVELPVSGMPVAEGVDPDRPIEQIADTENLGGLVIKWLADQSADAPIAGVGEDAHSSSPSSSRVTSASGI
jgi:hypothetical protein